MFKAAAGLAMVPARVLRPTTMHHACTQDPAKPLSGRAMVFGFRFVQGWDELCIQQLHLAEAATPSGRALLSTYPPGAPLTPPGWEHKGGW